MSKKTFMISSAGLRNIVFVSRNSQVIASSVLNEKCKTNYDEDDFHFIFGDKEIQMNRILADFISPYVSHMHQVDPTINSFNITPFYYDQNQQISEIFTNELLNNFKRISFGYPIEIDEGMSIKLRYLSFYLGNDEMFQQINQLFPIELTERAIDSCLQYIQYFEQIFDQEKYQLTVGKEALFDFISLFFHKIHRNKLLKLSRLNLYSILCNKNLKVKSEDSLFDFVNKIFVNDDNENDKFLNKMIFYEQIKIECLSKKKKKEFINNINLNEMSQNLWSNVRNYLITEISRGSENIMYFPYNRRTLDSFNGIINHLGNGNSRSTVIKGIVDITCSSVYDDSDDIQPINVLNYENDRLVFQSQSHANSWLCIDFNEYRVDPSHYSIKSPMNGGPGNGNLQNWCIEGSNNFDEWELLDVRKDEKSLDNIVAVNTFEIQNKNKNYYRYLRIRQNGVNSANDFDLFFSSIEFFGKIYRTLNID